MMGLRGYPENAGVLVVLVSTPSRSHIISIGFAQVRRNFIANAQELRLSCTNPSIYSSFENNRSSVLELPFPCWLHKPLIQIASLVHSMDLYFMSSVLFVLLVQVSHDQTWLCEPLHISCREIIRAVLFSSPLSTLLYKYGHKSWMLPHWGFVDSLCHTFDCLPYLMWCMIVTFWQHYFAYWVLESKT